MRNTQEQALFSHRTGPKSAHALLLLILLLALGLTAASWLKICTEACMEGHNYRLYGYTFETFGFPFFSVLILMHIFSYKYAFFPFLIALGLSTAFGAEMMFIYAQKYIIGSWCPLCLGIAAAVFLAFSMIAIQHLQKILSDAKKEQKGEMMKDLFKSSLCLLFVLVGFFFSFSGFAKFNQMQAAEKSIKDSITFGASNSPLEVYIFTDWECPSCRNVEPILEEASPEVMKKAKMIFVDLPVHPESMNFTPYNLSFMVHNKKEYFPLRDMLTELALKTKAPTDEQVEKAASKIGVKYEQLNYSDVAVGTKYFKHLAKQFSVDRTPTVIIVNKNTKKGKKLIGGSEITENNMLKALEALEK